MHITSLKQAKVVLLFLLMAILLAGSIVQFSPDKWSCLNCNVILISVDTLGAKNVAEETAPFLSSLARERGIVFTEAFAQSSWTLPSHAAMFTGENSAAPSVLPESAYTIAEALYDAGYQTHAISTGLFVQPQSGFGQGFETFDGAVGVEEDWDDLPELFETATDWVSTREDSRPFFLLLRPFHVHDPYDHVGAEAIAKANEEPSEEVVAEMLSLYHKGIREFDASFQALYEFLDEQQLLENTIIIVTSDHGEEFGEHGSVGLHGINTYRETIHIPLIIFHPNQKNRAHTFSVANNMIPKTIVDALGIDTSAFETPSRVRVKQHTALLSSTSVDKEGLLETYKHRDAVIRSAPQEFTDLAFRIPEAQGIATHAPAVVSGIYGKWHLIRTFDGTVQLFDMYNDPNEQHDVFQSSKSLSPSDAQSIQTLSKLLGL